MAIPIFCISTIQAVYNPAGFSGSWSIASGSSDHGIRKAVEAPTPIRQIMQIKRMNRNMLPAFKNKLSPAPVIFDNEGKNKAAVPVSYTHLTLPTKRIV